MSQMTESWRDTVARLLQQRDAAQSADGAVFKAFHDVYERLRRAEDVVAKMEGTDIELELQSALKESESLKDTLKEKEAKIGTLEDEVIALKIKLNKSTKEAKSLNNVITRLTNKLNMQSEEHQHRTKSIEMLNDEFIAMQIENNLLHDKVDKLEKENDDLVQRWLRKVQQDAEKINELLK